MQKPPQKTKASEEQILAKSIKYLVLIVLIVFIFNDFIDISEQNEKLKRLQDEEKLQIKKFREKVT